MNRGFEGLQCGMVPVPVEFSSDPAIAICGACRAEMRLCYTRNSRVIVRHPSARKPHVVPKAVMVAA